MNINYYFVRIETLGCRLNQVESEALAEIFLKEGFSLFHRAEADQEKPVCVCVLNTCTVTAKAEQKARRLIRLMLRQHPRAVVIVTGCYAQLEVEAIESIDRRVLAFPGRIKDRLINLPHIVSKHVLADYEDSDSFVEKLKEDIDLRLQKSFEDDIPLFALSASTFSFHSRATLKIQDGCNHACSFCRIRLARGKAVSLALDEVINRAQEIEANGAHEIVLSGVNLSQYKSGDARFADLLEALLQHTKNVQFRISSLYPEAITPRLTDVLADKRVCRHFHLSVQSGSDTILKAMRRPYKSDIVYRAVERLRSAKDDPFIGCDVITGFPGESDEDFALSYKMCDELDFTGIHAFPFSPRPDTAALKMTPKIPQRIAGERAAQLHTLAEKHYNAYLARWNKRVVDAVIEQQLKDGTIKVLTENYLSLILRQEDGMCYHSGKRIRIRVNGSEAVQAP